MDPTLVVGQTVSLSAQTLGTKAVQNAAACAIRTRTMLWQAVHKLIVLAQTPQTKFTNLLTATRLDGPQATTRQQLFVHALWQWTRLYMWAMTGLRIWTVARLNPWLMHTVSIVFSRIVNDSANDRDP
jgi:hypothetical protein